MGRHPAQVTQHSRPPRNTTTRPIGNQRNSYRTQQPGQLRNNNTPSIRSPQPLVNADGAPKSRSALMPSYSPPGDAPTSRSALQSPYFPPSGTSITGYTSPPVQLPLGGVPTPSYASQPPYLPFGGAPTSGLCIATCSVNSGWCSYIKFSITASIPAPWWCPDIRLCIATCSVTSGWCTHIRFCIALSTVTYWW